MIIRDSSQFKPKLGAYYLMSGDRKVAEFRGDNMTILEPNLVPFYFANNSNLDGWLLSRSIDTSRVNSRKLRKVLRIKVIEDIDLVKAVHGATITDTYWIKEPHECIKYDQVKFKLNDFTETSLLGLFDDISLNPSISPDLTGIGSLEKSWVRYDDFWFLLKFGADKELFSELLTFRLGEMLGLYMAEYRLSRKYKSTIESKDFTNNILYNYEPMFNLVGEDDDYQITIDCLYNLDRYANKMLIKDFLEIIFIDSLVANPDRHTFNYGILRDVDSGSILSMAPNFDNNLALLGSNSLSRVPKEFIDLFINVVKKNNLHFEVPALNLKDLEDMIIMTNAEFNNYFDSELVYSFILNNYNYIKSALTK